MDYALVTTESTWIGYNAQTGLCLDSNYNAFNHNVYTDPCNTGNYQNWQFVINPIIDGQTGLCLDSDIYGNVYTDSCNGGNYQNWQFVASLPSTGNIIRNRQTGLCLDSSNYNANNGNVYTDTCTGSSSQNWLPQYH